MCFGGIAQPPTPQTVDIPGLQATATQASAQNVAASLGLQQQVFPQLNAAQNTGLAAVGNNLSSPVQFNPVTPASANSPTVGLLNSAIGSAQNLENLNGAIPANIQAQARAAAGGNALPPGANPGPLGNISAQSLGTTQTALQQAALSQANTLAQQGIQQQALNNSVSQFNSQFGANIALQNQQLQTTGTGLLTGIQAPVSGLSPGDIASVAVGNTNTINAADQQAAADQAAQNNANNQFYSQLFGTSTSALSSLINPNSSLNQGLYNLFGTPSNATTQGYFNDAGNIDSSGVTIGG